MFTTASEDRLNKSDAKTLNGEKESLTDMARETGCHVREFVDSAEQNIKGASDTMTHKIRENPVQSSVIALGIGLLAGMLIRR